MFKVVIPARYGSTRFPGKPLADISGKTMVQHVYERAVEAGADEVVVATDDKRIEHAVLDFGGRVIMTSTDHQSGTERIAEVISLCNWPADTLVVNVQGDEPFIPAANIKQVADNLATSGAPMSTLSEAIHDPADLANPNCVKVVSNEQGIALYFSRSVMPYDRDQQVVDDVQTVYPYQRHIGIYAYRAGFVGRYIRWQPTQLEKVESLEQLRVLWYGEQIHVAPAVEPPPVGIDTPEDLARLLKQLN